MSQSQTLKSETQRDSVSRSGRLDLEAIVEIIPTGARVLDLGCGDGTLLGQLVQRKQVVARGVELSEMNVRACIARGLSVRQGNIEEGLADYLDTAFEYVILSQTLAFLDKPEPVVQEMLRVGKHAVISFENTSYWKERWRAARGGGAGYELCSGEPRMRAITLRQFNEFCDCCHARIERAMFLNNERHIHILPTLRAHIAVYVLTK
ncbi:MAG: methionine biosynthesis protein MetW [Chloroflexi bacterium]|nr:methionine biosynthesis protein MetW [Chloroflexota bacterium]